MKMMSTAANNVAVFARDHENNITSDYSKHFPPPIETENIKVSLAALRVVKELIYSREARSGLRNVLNDFRPVIAHAHNIYGRLTVSVLDELKAHGIPTVLTMHDLKLLCPTYLMLNKGAVCEKCRGGRYYNSVLTKCHKGSYAASAVYALETWINDILGKYDSVKLFISPSRFLRDKMIEYGWSPVRIVHVPNFIDGNALDGSRDIGRYNLYFGRLSREKGVKTLLKAYGRVKEGIPLMVVGDGPERAELEKLARDLALQVTFTGYLSGEPLHSAISNARAAIVPSEMYENAPLSILEAFSYGKPVVGSRIGGIPEMIDDRVNGLLFEAGNADDLADKLSLLATMSDQRIADMGKAALEKVKKEYSAETHYAKLMDVYSLALGRPCA